MDFWEKLRRRATEVNQSKVSRAVGLKPNTISGYLAKRSLPRADIAAKIAKALDVPLDWLLDGTQDWPPPSKTIEPTAADLSDATLMTELLKRRRRIQLDLLDDIDAAEKIDWTGTRKHFAKAAPGAEVPPNLRVRALLAASLVGNFYRATAQYEWSLYEAIRGQMLPKGSRTDQELDPTNWGKRAEKLLSDADFTALAVDAPTPSHEHTVMRAWINIAKLASGEMSIDRLLSRLRDEADREDAKTTLGLDARKSQHVDSPRSDSGRPRKAKPKTSPHPPK